MVSALASFNLLSEPWIGIEGKGERVGILEALRDAHRFRALRDPSPLVSASIHRLLTAVVQDMMRPTDEEDLVRLLEAGRFSDEALKTFAAEFQGRFDIFSKDTPFLQSNDLSPAPERGVKSKVASYLVPEIPTATEKNHFRHAYDVNASLCPACAAAGLVTIPAFATSGGRGIKPSINGVPPIYVLPAGGNLFENLALSLVLPGFQPRVAAGSNSPWWRRSGTIGGERDSVGYLESLTFPARRVRLHPISERGTCTRCGTISDTKVQTMFFQMGESRPKDAPFWQDPFAAYRMGKGERPPIPVRPRQGRVLWRDYATLFLDHGGRESHIRPSVIEQIRVLIDAGALPRDHVPTFRYVGLRTDMKTKVFEWVEGGFEVPPFLLRDPSAAAIVQRAIDFAEWCAFTVQVVFRKYFGAATRKSERHLTQKVRMAAGIWNDLASPFRDFILGATEPDERTPAFNGWLKTVVRISLRNFMAATKIIGDDGDSLRRRVEAETECRRRLFSKRKKEVIE